MITKITLGKIEDVLLVQLGTGDVMFHQISSDEMKYALSFAEHEPRPIGATTQEYAEKNTDELVEMVGKPIRLVFNFTKPESVTALIHSLIEVQERMFDGQKQEIENKL